MTASLGEFAWPEGTVAAALDLPMEWFLDSNPLLDWSGEWQLLHTFRKLKPQQQQAVIELIRDLSCDVPFTDRR